MPFQFNKKLTFEPFSVQSARKLQTALRSDVVIEDHVGEIELVAGVDAGYEKNGNMCRAAVAVLQFPGLKLCEYKIARLPVTVPYIPGLLSFRELPAILAAIGQLERQPDIFLCDGQGIAHPRRLGIASHLGVLLDRPTIGVAKSRLIGTHEKVGEKKGDASLLLDAGEAVGWVLRTREGVKPIYVSPGHNVSLESARDIVMRCTTKYRLPETTRWAHRLASTSAGMSLL